MPNIGLIVALNAEVPSIFLDTSILHQLDDHLIKVAVSGIGRKRAGKTTKNLCEKKEGFSPDYLINLGFCGATKDELKIGDLIVADRLNYNNQKIQLKNTLIDKLKEIFQETSHYIGKLQTFDCPVFSRSGVCEDTIAVDMESFAICETSMKYQTPIIVIKIVSDIVPKKLSVNNLWSQLRSIIKNKRYAQSRLNEVIQHYFDESPTKTVFWDERS